MLKYQLTGFTTGQQSLIKLCEYSNVTFADITEIGDIISYLQLPLYQVQPGDSITIFIVDNRLEKTKGFLAIWHNKGVACISTDSIRLWGEWEEKHHLVLSEELEVGEEMDGAVIMGRVAYNTDGVRGIYSQGKFFRQLDYLQELDSIHGSALADRCEQLL